MPKYSFIDRSGRNQEVELDVTAYRAAADAGMSLSEYLEVQYPSSPDHGSTFEQLMLSSGLFLKNKGYGIQPPTLKQVLEGGPVANQLNVGTITRQDQPGTTPSGRLLFPEVVLQAIALALTEDQGDFLSGYQNMIAVTQNVPSEVVQQPRINATGPEASRAMPIGQLAEPASMVSITVSDTVRRIPTRSIGLQVSDQALAITTLDLVNLIMTAQARGERIALVEEQLADMINGDTDAGESALSSITAQSLDAVCDAAGEITQKAWIKYLRANYRKMTISNIICDVETALLIENRAGKPTVNNDDPRSPRIDSLFSVDNLGITAPRVLLVATSVTGANTIIGLDRRYAIRRLVNVNASYSAIEQYVMRRATSFRIDYGEMAHKLYTDAWSKMTLTV
jgi:hypothetical protein